jgi:5-methylcytosine-specific restriction endonuclease McrA
VPHKNYAGPEWQAVRRLVLDRDCGVCQIHGDKCKRRATEVDHIVNVDDGGARLDPANLRAACKSCNVAKRNREVAARARRARVDDDAVTWDCSTPEGRLRASGYDW